MKKIIALFLIFLLILTSMCSFIGCTDESVDPDNGIGPGIGGDGDNEEYPEYVPDTPLIPLV